MSIKGFKGNSHQLSEICLPRIEVITSKYSEVVAQHISEFRKSEPSTLRLVKLIVFAEPQFPLSSLPVPNLKGTNLQELQLLPLLGFVQSCPRLLAMSQMSACNAAETTWSVSARPHPQATVNQLLAIPVTTRPSYALKGAPVLRERSSVVFNCNLP